MLTLATLPEFVSKLTTTGVHLMTLHWTVGLPNQIFDNDYHFQIVQNGDIHVDPRAFDSQGNFQPLAHAWHHNSANIGISVCGMYGATQPEYGYTVDSSWVTWPHSYYIYHPTKEQMISMVTLSAYLLKHYNLPLSQLFSHYQLAQSDGYEGERWEWFYELAEIKQQVLQVKV